MKTTKVVRVPGKLMIAGEYSVLFGGQALAYTVDTYLELEASVSDDQHFHISSEYWDDECVVENLQDLVVPSVQKPLIHALAHAQKTFGNDPLKICVHSKLDRSAGMGTSSAVILAACAASQMFGQRGDLNDCAPVAIQVQKSLQGHASGYDILTQFHGGLVLIQGPRARGEAEVLRRYIKPYPEIYPFAGGQGSATGPLIQETLKHFEADASFKKDFLASSSQLVEALLKHWKDGNASTRSQVFSINRDHRELSLSVLQAPSALVRSLKSLKGCDRDWTFKTTGAGGEDSLLFFGEEAKLQEAFELMKAESWYPLNAGFTHEGLSLRG